MLYTLNQTMAEAAAYYSKPVMFVAGNDSAHEPNTRAKLKEKMPDYYKYLVGVFGFDPDAPATKPLASAE